MSAISVAPASGTVPDTIAIGVNAVSKPTVRYAIAWPPNSKFDTTAGPARRSSRAAQPRVRRGLPRMPAGSPTADRAPVGIVLTHFIVSDDVERSRRFYTEVLGGRVAFGPVPINIALANSWIVINAGGGPTDDKPTVTLETPRDPDRVSSFLNIRVKDIEAVYAEWSARGAQFLTPPKRHQYEIRCYIRDPDGHLIEVGQTTDPAGDWSPAHWSSSTPAEESE